MTIIAFTLQLCVIVAIVVFIIYTVVVYRHIQEHINNLDKVLKDHEVYLTKEIEFRNNVSKIIEEYTNIITLCNNTNLEVISKLRASKKDRDNKYNLISDRIKANSKRLDDIYVILLGINNQNKNKANFSYNTEKMIPILPENKENKPKLKTAKNQSFTRVNGINKKNRNKQ